ncbi:hypothetical protein HN011_011007 [Eciton burchellii]|nr:hypothetical protein HN011_011007 [Eciton burchellii]
MHTISDLNAGVPAFLAKLWKLVEDPETNDLICWSPNGKSFFIRNQAQFARELLPHYYKHNNMASFVRQLNMYGFHKKVSVELGGLKCDKDEMEFAHQFFCKDHPYLLEYIKRKIASSKTQDPAHTPIKPELMNKMLAEVRNMRGRQESLDSKLGTMKHENEALWRELAMLRQKHMKQQQIVNKLIHFLVTLVQPSSRAGGLPVKRRYPLMIDDTSRLNRNKRTKLAKQASPTGPVIHELDASEPDLDSEYIVAEILENETSIRNPQNHTETINDSIETIHFTDDTIQSESDVEMNITQEIDIERKCREKIYKDKKKRKNKMPIRISIPPLENGDKPRKEQLEVPDKKGISATITLAEELINSRPPIMTMHNSKLAAMAANINKNSDVEQDINVETSSDLEDAETLDNDSALVKLEDILIVPDMITRKDMDKMSEKDIRNKEINKKDNDKNVSIKSNDEQNNKNSKLKQEQTDANRASTSSSKDLSLSCVNSSGMSDVNYRSESREEMDTHLESMQNELDNLRDVLRNEGYSINANAILGLFGTEDPMTFELPVNPELNPNSEKEDDDHINSINRSAPGELMAYNPTLLDFDEDIFMGNSSLSTNTPDLLMNNLYTLDSSDPLGLEDNKSSILDSLVTSNMNRKS